MPLTRLRLSAIAEGGITSTELEDGTIIGVDVADGVISVDKLSATGTKNSTTFLRGDNSFQEVAVTPTAVSDQDNTSTGQFVLPEGTTAQRPVLHILVLKDLILIWVLWNFTMVLNG